MKEHKNKIIVSIIAIIILVGIIIVSTVGFKVNLKYHANKKIEINMSKKFELDDIKKIASDVLDEKVIAQKVEIYEDAVKIVAEEINEEEKNEIVNKINEKYELNIESNEIKVEEVANARIRDLVKPYFTPFIVLTLVILIYMVLRYYRLNSFMVFYKTILNTMVGQAITFSLFAIFRIEIGFLTVPIAIVTYILTMMYLAKKFEEESDELKKEEE